MAFSLLVLLAEAVQRASSKDIQASMCNGRCGETYLVEIVNDQDLPIATRLDCRHTLCSRLLEYLAGRKVH